MTKRFVRTLLVVCGWIGMFTLASLIALVFTGAAIDAAHAPLEEWGRAFQVILVGLIVAGVLIGVWLLIERLWRWSNTP